MAIYTLDQFIGSTKQKIHYQKVTAVSVAGQWQTLFNLNGTPGAGSFNWIVQSNASLNGVVVDYSRPGFPSINPFGINNVGYLSKFAFANTVAGRYMIYDRIWEAGPFACSGTGRMVSLFTNASTYEYRVPLTSTGKRDWSQLEMWIDVSTTFSATATTLSLKYINQDGSASTSPATLTLSSFVTGRTFQMPLAAGDKGVQRITDVSIGGATNALGIFNVYLARPLYTDARVNAVNVSDVHTFEKTGMPNIDASAAIAINYAADSTATGIVDNFVEIING